MFGVFLIKHYTLYVRNTLSISWVEREIDDLHIAYIVITHKIFNKSA